jgi:hypothetical protein
VRALCSTDSLIRCDVVTFWDVDDVFLARVSPITHICPFALSWPRKSCPWPYLLLSLSPQGGLAQVKQRKGA